MVGTKYLPSRFALPIADTRKRGRCPAEDAVNVIITQSKVLDRRNLTIVCHIGRIIGSEQHPSGSDLTDQKAQGGCAEFVSNHTLEYHDLAGRKMRKYWLGRNKCS